MKAFNILRGHVTALRDWRTWAVFRRNARVYLRNWRTAFLPPAMEPVVYFLAFGMGLGTFIGSILYEGEQVAYGTYVAPGLLAFTAFSTSFFEALYGSYVRMFYQKTWDGILGTQVELQHILWGEVTWAGCRGGMNSAVVMLVLLLFDLSGLIAIDWSGIFLILPIAFLAGWAFGSFAIIFTAIVPSIDHMNFPVFLVGIPLGMTSNTYFPLEERVPELMAIIPVNPLYHLAEINRGLLLHGSWAWHVVGLLLTGSVLLFGCMTIAQKLMEKRLFGQ
jgi:lipooligosaccharide transport system permease protein